MRFLSLAAILALTSASPAEAQMAGVWHGVGTQVDPGGVEETWEIHMTIRPGRASSIDYPTIKCSGDLTVVSSSPSEIEFSEAITQGDCITHGRIVARLRDQKIFWSWYVPGGKLAIDASAVLYPNDHVAEAKTRPEARLHHRRS